MAALTFSQIEAQVRALLSDAGAGSSEFTPEQMARAIDFAQVQSAKQLGITYHELPLEVVNRKVAIPSDVISVIRVEISEEVVQDPPFGALGIRIGSDPNYEHFPFTGEFVDVGLYPSTYSFMIVEVAFKPRFDVADPAGLSYLLFVVDQNGMRITSDINVGGTDGNVAYDQTANSVTIQFAESVFGEQYPGGNSLQVYASMEGVGEHLAASFSFLGHGPT